LATLETLVLAVPVAKAMCVFPAEPVELTVYEAGSWQMAPTFKHGHPVWPVLPTVTEVREPHAGFVTPEQPAAVVISALVLATQLVPLTLQLIASVQAVVVVLLGEQ